MVNKKINIALVGLTFGSDFVPIYKMHPEFELLQPEEEDPILFEMKTIFNGSCPRGQKINAIRVRPPDRKDLLPPSIQKLTEKVIINDNKDPKKSFEAGDGHDGSHPCIDEIRSANWSAPGICAHLSALQNGVEIKIPDFSLKRNSN